MIETKHTFKSYNLSHSVMMIFRGIIFVFRLLIIQFYFGWIESVGKKIVCAKRSNFNLTYFFVGPFCLLNWFAFEPHQKQIYK